jgi:predicted nucleic acid-binding protein
MIVLDTSVVSEVMRAAPSPVVVAWLNHQEAFLLYMTAVTVAEIRYGLRVLPRGRRQRSLEEEFERVLVEGFTGRILPFDEAAAHRYGEVMGRRKEIGRPLGILDGQIAAIAWVNGFSVATRNVQDFLDCGVDILNPFTPE